MNLTSVKTQLVRKCKCGEVMVVDVGTPTAIVDYVINRTSIGYTNIECVQGCYLNIVLYDSRYGYKPLNTNHFTRAVNCKSCQGIRHLSQFVPIQT